LPCCLWRRSERLHIELHNLAADPAHRQPLERLFAALKQWSADTQDTSTPLPLKP
jgi:hypothetical protein